jgi:hypothetical protein
MHIQTLFKHLLVLSLSHFFCFQEEFCLNFPKFKFLTVFSGFCLVNVVFEDASRTPSVYASVWNNGRTLAFALG